MNPIDEIRESYEFIYALDVEDKITTDCFQIRVTPKLYAALLVYEQSSEFKSIFPDIRSLEELFDYPVICDVNVSEERGVELHSIILPKNKDRKPAGK